MQSWRAPPWAAWFRGLWFNRGQRLRVFDGYEALGKKHQETLADIAQRGFLHSPTFVPGDSHASAFNAGRQSLAQEIVELARCDPERLRRIVEDQVQPAKG